MKWPSCERASDLSTFHLVLLSCFCCQKQSCVVARPACASPPLLLRASSPRTYCCERASGSAPFAFRFNTDTDFHSHNIGQREARAAYRSRERSGCTLADDRYYLTLLESGVVGVGCENGGAAAALGANQCPALFGYNPIRQHAAVLPAAITTVARGVVPL